MGSLDQVHDHFVAGQQFPPPVRGDLAEHAMFDLVPLAGARAPAILWVAIPVLRS